MLVQANTAVAARVHGLEPLNEGCKWRRPWPIARQPPPLPRDNLQQFVRQRRGRLLRMKILVTGAAGFIGMHVAQRLLARGDTVVGLDNLNDYYDAEAQAATAWRA